jgi:hypothetical protein
MSTITDLMNIRWISSLQVESLSGQVATEPSKCERSCFPGQGKGTVDWHGEARLQKDISVEVGLERAKQQINAKQTREIHSAYTVRRQRQTRNQLVFRVHCLEAFPFDQLCVLLTAHLNLHSKGRRVFGDLRDCHGVDGCLRVLNEIKAVQQPRNRDPYVHLAHLPPDTDAAT